MSLKEKIFQAKDIQSEITDIPEWGVKIEIRGMNGASRSKIMGAVMDEMGNIQQSELYPLLLIACCFDPETGEPIFQNNDKKAIMEKSGAVLERIAGICSRLSGIGTEAREETEKN